MKIALFILLTIYLVIPILIYRLNSQKVARFCLFMTISHNCRKFYCYALLLAVIYFHFIFYQSFRTEYGLMVSSLILVAMFSTRLTEKVLSALADDNKRLMAFTVMTLVAAFIPHLLPLSITMAIILVGVAFYPSQKIRAYDEYYLTGYFNRCLLNRDFRDFEDMYFT